MSNAIAIEGDHAPAPLHRSQDKVSNSVGTSGAIGLLFGALKAPLYCFQKLGFSIWLHVRNDDICQPICRWEVAWALEKVKKDAAPGKDGVTVDMMSAEVLFDVWCALFEVCWEYGMVPSVWRESLVVPVLKK